MTVPHDFEGGLGVIQAPIALGTSSVSTQSKLVGVVRKKLRITAIKVYGQAAVTGTSISAIVYARTTAGAAGNALNSALSIKFASAAAAKAGSAATLTTTKANLVLSPGQLLEVTFTASSITAGPGDVVVDVEYEPVA